jgi:hypothetical protein
MKKIIYIIGVSLLCSCSQLSKISDSEIDAIRDQTKAVEKQTEVIKEQNKILQEISSKLK